MLVSPLFSVDPSFPTEGKAGQPVKKLVYLLELSLAVLLQVSKLFPANGGLNSPKIPFYLHLQKQLYKAPHSTVWDSLAHSVGQSQSSFVVRT